MEDRDKQWRALSKYAFAGILFLVLFFYFLTWAVQTAWLGSFPGRDVTLYSWWAYSEFAASIIFLVASVWCIVKAARIYNRL